MPRHTRDLASLTPTMAQLQVALAVTGNARRLAAEIGVSVRSIHHWRTRVVPYWHRAAVAGVASRWRNVVANPCRRTQFCAVILGTRTAVASLAGVSVQTVSRWVTHGERPRDKGQRQAIDVAIAERMLHWGFDVPLTPAAGARRHALGDGNHPYAR